MTPSALGACARPAGPRVLVVLVAVLAACAARPVPRLVVGDMPGLDVYLAAHPVAAERPIRVDEVGRTAGASYHLVQACASERPHRHATHDLTAIVLRGRGRLEGAGPGVRLGPGDVAVVPRGRTHWFARDAGCAVALVVFTPPLDAPDTVPVDTPGTGR